MTMALTLTMFLLVYQCWTMSMTLTWSQNVPVPACDVGWFGSNCQYKCRCNSRACDRSGLCAGGVCESGWFGPQCQYVDLLYPKDPQKINWLNDGNASTCNSDQSLTVTVNMSSEFPFTWLRLQVNQPSLLQEFQVTFTDNKKNRTMSCENTRSATVDERTLDIHCDMDDVVQFVILEGDGVKSLCSLYVSGGRNVALRQKTTQSSKYIEYLNGSLIFAPEYAVDGNVDSEWSHGSCMSTIYKVDQNPNWNVTLSPGYIIQRYIIYNRKSHNYRIKGFSLRSFTKDLVMVFNYTDMEDEALSVYKITSAPKTPPVSIVNILANRNFAELVLNMCEVELYGDSACPPSMYGRECQYTCNCAVKNESCFVSTGGCPSGCAAGYQGEDCQQPCSFGKYGDGCNSSCSQFCVAINKTQSSCFHNNGSCVLGCVSGYQDRTCENLIAVSNEGISYVVTVVAPLLFIFIVVMVTILGTLLWRRFKTLNEDLSTLVDRNGNEDSCDCDAEVERVELEVTNSNNTMAEYKQHRTVNQILTGRQNTPNKTVLDIKEENDNVYVDLYDEPINDLKENISEYNIYNKFVFSSTSIQVRDLLRFVISQDKSFFQQQFHSMLEYSNTSNSAGMRKENKEKDQYNNICSYDNSPALLKTSMMWGDYFNASYIGGYKGQRKFIASQGPIKNTLEYFFRMLLEQDVEIVVMLTNLTENGKTMCERYWPEDDVVKVGDIKVKLITTQEFADYSIRRHQLLRYGDCIHELTQFHFTAWPDKHVPTTVWSLVDFQQRLSSVSTDKPIVVHCSDGFGRTGTFIALCDVIMEAKDTGYIDFFTAVQRLRQGRAFMVQTSDQYEFLHRAAMVAFVCMGTTIEPSNITERIEALKRTIESGESRLEQF